MSSHKRIHTLDLLRFFAAFGVVIYHFAARPGSEYAISSVAKFGYLGVPIFFMISGFVIAISAQGRTAYQFGVSRFARLYPGLWVGIAFTTLVVYLVAGTAPQAIQVITNAMLINDYVGQPDIDGVYWTLQTEIKFYACVFLLIAVGLFPKYKIWLSIWLGLTVLHRLTGEPFFLGWFISPAWSPYFIAGVAMFHMSENKPGPFNLTVLIFALLLGAIHSYESASGFIWDATLADRLIASGLFLLSALGLVAIALRVLAIGSFHWVVTLGAMTYPLYLIHNKAGKALIDGPLSFLSEFSAIFVTVAFMLFCSYVIFRFVERPLGNAIRRFFLAFPDRLAIIKNVIAARS